MGFLALHQSFKNQTNESFNFNNVWYSRNCIRCISYRTKSKDEKIYEKEMDNDYDKPLSEGDDIDMKK